MGHTSSRYFHVLFYEIKQLHHTRDFLKPSRLLKKTVANELLNGTTGAVGDIQRHHAKYFPVVETSAFDRFVPPPVEQVCDRRRNKWLLDLTAACQSWICPLLQVMCLWYMCFCAEVFFFCSHTVLPNGA